MLKYVNSGVRFYKTNPVYPYERPYTEFQLIASGTARPWYEEEPSASEDPPSPRLWLHAKHHVHGWRDTSDSPSEIAVFHFSALHPLMEAWLHNTPVQSVPVSLEEARTLQAWAEESKILGARATAVDILTLEKIQLDLSCLILKYSPSPAGTQPNALAEQRVEEACSLYIGHLRDAWSAEQIAGHIGLSPPHLRRLFLQVKGRPPKEVYTEIRMDIARRRLQRGEETIAELSAQLGFSEPSAFSRAYTTYFGHSPRQAPVVL